MNKQKIIIAGIGIAVFALVGLGIMLLAFAKNSTDPRSSAGEKKTLNQDTGYKPVPEMTEVPTKADQQAVQPTQTTDQEMDQTLSEIDKALDDLNTSTAIPTINESDFR